MAAALRGALCACLLLSVSGIVPKPQNARINSVNLQSILQWDPPRFHKGNLSYTVQAKSRTLPKDDFKNLRTNLSLTECDISSLSVYGDYVLRVRAESKDKHSNWAVIRFKPMDDTIVGAPDVKVKSESGCLHVDFTGPIAEREHDRWSLRQYYGSWQYRLLYWKKGRDTEVIHIDTKHSSEILTKLEPWTVYCIQVQAVIPEWNKTGELSQELCEQTTHNGVTPVWIIMILLLGSMLAFVVVVPVCFFCLLYLYQFTKRVFCPSYVFPQHLKEKDYIPKKLLIPRYALPDKDIFELLPSLAQDIEMSKEFLSKPPSGSQFFSPRPKEEHHLYDKLTIVSEGSKNQSDETVDEASKTTDHHHDSEREVSDLNIFPASERD